MKKLKLNKKMVNTLIGFTGFTLISSLSSCKCSGIDIEDPSITSELTSEDESVVSIVDNSEVTTEVSSEELTSENNSELTSESSSEEVSDDNQKRDPRNPLYIDYSDEFKSLPEEEQNAKLERFKELLAITWDEYISLEDSVSTKIYHEKTALYLEIYGEKYLNQLIRENLVSDFIFDNVGYYYSDDEISVHTDWPYVIIIDYKNHIQIRSSYVDYMEDYGKIKYKEDGYLSGYCIGASAEFQLKSDDVLQKYKLEESFMDDVTDKYLEYQNQKTLKIEK